MKKQPKREWLFTAQSDFYSVTERVFDEKRLNHLARFVKKAHDRQFLKQNPKPSYIYNRMEHKEWVMKKEDAALIVQIIPYSYATS